MTVESTVEKKKPLDDKRQTQKKKLNKHMIEIKKLKEEKSHLHEELLRQTAEFDNYKKKTV